jgi:hypothetical protein
MVTDVSRQDLIALVASELGQYDNRATSRIPLGIQLAEESSALNLMWFQSRDRPGGERVEPF